MAPIKIFADEGVDEVDSVALTESVEHTGAPSLPFGKIEQCKENIQPISQGRKINLLFSALSIADDDKAKKERLESHKEEFKKQIDKLDDLDKKLNVWFKYIDWLEQNVPDGGKVNGITNAIEECIEFYHDKRQFKQDERLFRIFMKFKRFCDDPREIFNFMYANSITHLLAQFYLHWSWQYEVCGNMKRALELIKLGIENLASPRETLIEAEKQMNLKIAKMIKRGDYDPEEDISQKPTSSQNQQAAVPDVNIRAALQTLKFKQTKKGSKVSVKRTGAAVDRQNTGGLQGPQMINGVMQVVKPKPVIKTTQKSVPVFKDSLKSSTSIAPLMQKIPTKQKVKALGQTGAENCVIERKALCSRKD